MAGLSKPKQSRAQKLLREAIVRQFDGGWNVVDNDLTMKPTYSKILSNMVRAPDGSHALRYGTTLHATISDEFPIVGLYSYANALVSVLSDGSFHAFYNGTDHVLNTTLWPPMEDAQLAACEFNGELIIVNGIDKPVLIPVSLVPRYLQDLGTGSNINVPISQYVVTHGEYTIHAGMVDTPSVLSISNRGSSGTYIGDAIPNDAVLFDLGPYINRGAAIITGLGSFRDRLIVCFNDNIAIVILGEYDTDGNHVPRVEDVIHNHGAISHNAIVDLGDDMVFLDIVGVPSIKRAQFTQTLTPVRVSELIDPAIQTAIRNVSLTTHARRTFAVHDRVQRQTLFFIPNNDRTDSTTETQGFVLTTPVTPRVKVWSEFRDMLWRCGTVSSEGDVYLARDGMIFRYGNQADPVYTDLEQYAETWDDGTVFTDGTGWLPVSADSDGGLPIKFVWELPWTHLDTRTTIKNSRYIMIDTQGTGSFTAMMFIDNIYRDRTFTGETWTDGTLFDDGYGWEAERLDPTLTMDFVGGDRGGFGVETLSDEFGGGRITSDERLYAWVTKFKLQKLRFEGTTVGPLKFIATGILFLLGSIMR